MKTAYTCLVLCAILSIFTVTACDNDVRSGRQGGRLQVQQNEDGIEVRAPDGTVLIKGNQERASILLKTDQDTTEDVSTDTKNPMSDFPADIPLLPESTVVMSQVFQGGRNAIATITARQPADDVIRFYEDQIPQKGWEQGSRYNLDNIVMLSGKNGAANLNISITSEADLITINIARTESTDK